MPFKVKFTLPSGEEDEILEDGSYEAKLFDSEDEAEEAASQYISDSLYGSEILHASNPGDYDEDEADDYEYEIIEVEE